MLDNIPDDPIEETLTYQGLFGDRINHALEDTLREFPTHIEESQGHTYIEIIGPREPWGYADERAFATYLLGVIETIEDLTKQHPNEQADIAERYGVFIFSD